MANTCASTQSNGNNRPIFCVDGVDKSSEAYKAGSSSGPNNLTWDTVDANGGTSDSSGNYYTPTVTPTWSLPGGGTKTPVNLYIQFDSPSTSDTPTQDPYFNGARTIHTSGDKVELKITDGKGLRLGETMNDDQIKEGHISNTLRVNYGYEADKTFILDIGAPTGGGPSLIGNIEIQNQSTNRGLLDTFTATLGKGMKGSIWLIDASGNNTVKIKEGNLEGNIRTGFWHRDGKEHINSKITIDFTDNSSGRIIGDIFNADQTTNDQTTQQSPTQNRYHHLAVTVKNGGLQGNVRDFTVYGNQIGNLSVTFEEGATMHGNIMGGTGGPSASSNTGNDHQKKIVTFKGASSASTIVMTGDIISYGTGSTNGNNSDYTKAGNHVTFEKGSMRGSILASLGIGNGQSGGNGTGTTTNYGQGYNNIIFKQDGAMITSSWGASPKKIDSIFTEGGRNDITFEGNGTIDVFVGATKKSVSNGATISSKGHATNLITFKSNGTLTKDVKASNSGYNVFNLGTSGKSLDIQGAFNAVGGSSSRGRNIIYLGGISETASSTQNTNGGTYTLKNTKGGTITFTGTNGSGNNVGQNLISFKEDGATLHIGDNGRGTLLTTGGHTIINDGYDTNGSGTPQNRIETKSGITVVAHTIKAAGKNSETNNGAQNKLELQHGKFSQIIATGTHDQNTLIFTADNGNATAARNDGASNGTLSAQSGDTITFNSNSSDSSNNSKNIITFQGKNGNSQLQSATLTIGPNGSSDKYHTLHTTGGTTEINFRADGNSSSSKTIENSTLKGNILTTGGQTSITFSGNGTIQGSIKSQGGQNQITLENQGKSLDLQATLDATSTGTNTIKLGNGTNGNGTYTIKNGSSGNGGNGMVTFTGSRSPNGSEGTGVNVGKNIIEFKKETQTLKIGDNGTGGILTTGGETLINMTKSSTIQLAILEATGTNGQQYAENIISLNRTNGSGSGENYTIKNGDSNGTVAFKGNNYGFNTIKFTQDNQTLKIGDGNGTAKISTESGNTVFKLAKTSTIQGTIETSKDGSTRFDFANPNGASREAERNGNVSKLTLKGTITAKDGGENIFDFTKKGSYEISKDPSNGTATIKADTGGKNIFSIRDEGDTTLTFNQVTFTGDGTHHFSFDNSTAQLTLKGTAVTGDNAGFYVAAATAEAAAPTTATNTGAHISFDFNSGGILNNSVKTQNGSNATTTFTVGAGQTGTVNGSITTAGGTTNIDFTSNGSTLRILGKTTNAGTNGVSVAAGTTGGSINTTGGTTNINIKSSGINSTLDVKTIETNGTGRTTGSTTITFANGVSSSTLNLKGDKFTITTIDKGDGRSNVINLTDSARSSFQADKDRKDFRVLEVGGGVKGNGETTVLLYANPHAEQNNGTKIGGQAITGNSQQALQAVASGGTGNTYGKYAYSDRLIIEGSGANGGKSPINIGVIFDDGVKLEEIKYNGGGTNQEGNIAVATVKDNSGVNVQAVDTVLGFDVARVTLTEEKTTKAG
ncbi:beta strand repeat-containing protein, partial [Helicobacter pametensis]|uniref:beta strand repeat-containing protein n=1 Tax=Helicobacter pametensis TaxID=95149 RepID=UPI0013154335